MPNQADIPGALALLNQILERRKSSGQDTIRISEESIGLLRSIPGLIAHGNARQQPSPTAAAVQEEEKEGATKKAAPEHPYGELATGTEQRGRFEIIHPVGETVRDKLNNLFRIAKIDVACNEMETLRDQLVFATGNPEAEIMFVGEAPGAEEENQKKPFVGPAGKKLDQIIQAMGLSREKVYISNIVKWRPRIGDDRMQGTRNRKPTHDEMAVSVKFIRSEIEVIKPKAIVALGGTAAEGLLDESGSVSGMRGRFFEVDNIPVAVTYHPSYLLRAEGESDKEHARAIKRKVWEDMLMVMEKIGMPISEKQRGFFTK